MSDTVTILVLDGFQGTTSDLRYPDGFEIDSYGLKESVMPDSQRHITGITIAKKHDANSPKLALYADQGTLISTATLAIVTTERAGILHLSKDIVTMTFEDVNVADFRIFARDNASYDDFMLIFGSLKMDYGHSNSGPVPTPMPYSQDFVYLRTKLQKSGRK